MDNAGDGSLVADGAGRQTFKKAPKAKVDAPNATPLFDTDPT
jgi:hypothetical protein